MNKLIASTGLALLGAAVSSQAASIYAPAPELTSKDKAKPWSVSATVRGFYDDNVLSNYDGIIRDNFGNIIFDSEEIDSFGIEAGPNVGLHMAMEQTYLSIDYGYRYVWYAESDLEDDQRHRVDFELRHAFTERLKVSLTDSFIKTREPEIGGTVQGATAGRADASMLRNVANADAHYEFTDLFSMGLGYENRYLDYSDDQYDTLLSRMENYVSIDGRWKALPDLTALVGYQFGYVDFIGDDDLIIPDGFGGTIAEDPDIKNRVEHYFFAGVDHSLVENLVGSIRIGGQYTDYENADEDAVTPYTDGRLTYTYNQGSRVMFGATHRIASTDVAYTLSTETTTIYGNWKHMITPKLYGRLDGQAQFSEFKEGAWDGDNEDLYMVGVGFGYQINEFWATDLSYRYTTLDSDVPARDFDRNRVYLGVTASY